ncbi:MAG: metallophosphoesterase family protein [Selenomonadaceae bacterium]|nr:metallophosphoesterase family protein [Selenomonadaceae bacterium]
MERSLRALLFLGIDFLFPDHLRPRAEAAEVYFDGSHPIQDYLLKLSASHLRAVITKDSAHEAMIMCQSDKPLKKLMVEIGRMSEDRLTWFGATEEKLTLGGASVYIYSSPIKGLEENAVYRYRFVADDAASDWGELATFVSDKTEAIVFTDSQCGGDYSDWYKTFNSAVNRHKNAKLAINLGDIVDNGEALWHWEGWYKGIEENLRKRIFAPIIGNHECYSLKWKYCLPKGFLGQFKTPANNSEKFEGYYYSFDYGPVHFIALNNNFLEIDPNLPGLLEEELIWLEKDAIASDKPWKIVLMHKDILAYNEYNAYTNDYGGLNDIAHDFMGVFDKLNIDLVLTGHMHVYRNRGQIYNFQPSDKGPYYILCGLSGNARYDVPKDEVFDKVVLPGKETDNYLHLTATKEELSLVCYLPDGKVLDEVILRK